YIKNVIAKLREDGKTIIIIAHRLATVTQADTIFVINSGKLAEQGTHSELLEAKGQYANYWQAQTQVFN
ncbi:MAG: ABC transporter ATP-binding protein, partial [Bacteroidales bacterium]|nr:ABC transporter ATP-binding protein [Bacteroidales bacterium]